MLHGDMITAFTLFFQGFDAAYGDSVGNYQVTPGMFGLMTKVNFEW